MQNDIHLSVLNWNRDPSRTLVSLKGHDGPLTLFTNDPGRGERTLAENGISGSVRECPANVAEAKNLMISSARESGAQWLFIVEDDVEARDSGVFSRYVDLMRRFHLGVVFFGYANANFVLENKPNPCIIIRLDREGNEVYCNRHCCSAVFGFDLVSNRQEFDPGLLVMEHEEYLQRCANESVIPFNGFYFDLPESWRHLSRIDVPTQRIKTVELAKTDRKYIDEKKIELKLEVSADKLLSYVQKVVAGRGGA